MLGQNKMILVWCCLVSSQTCFCGQPEGDRFTMSELGISASSSQASFLDSQKPIELSVVLPCLNEAETLERCLVKVGQTIKHLGICGEIVVADNGSTDGSQAIAARLGVRVVNVAERGYGSALMGGIAAARGGWIVIGDADDSYDFSHIPAFPREAP